MIPDELWTGTGLFHHSVWWSRTLTDSSCSLTAASMLEKWDCTLSHTDTQPHILFTHTHNHDTGLMGLDRTFCNSIMKIKRYIEKKNQYPCHFWALTLSLMSTEAQGSMRHSKEICDFFFHLFASPTITKAIIFVRQSAQCYKKSWIQENNQKWPKLSLFFFFFF